MKRISVISPLAAAALLAIAVAVAGCNTPIQPSTPVQAADTAPAAVPSVAPQTDIPIDKPAPGRKVIVYSVSEDKNGDRKLEPRSVSLPAGDAQTPATYALKMLADGSKSPLPKGTTLKSVKIGAGGVATTDFSKEFKTNFVGGDSAEALAINSVLATMGQFQSVKSVQFLVEGAKIDSLGGNQSLDEPLPVPQASPAAPPASPASVPSPRSSGAPESSPTPGGGG